MVYFNCNVCGESLKKNQVEKHYQQKCRNCSVLSCVDCGQEFHGTDYEKHIKCISEEEKYSGKNYKPKPNANKGEQKQEQWINQVQEAITKVNANPNLKSLLEQLKNYPNIPRKQAKFENFLANSLRIRDSNLARQAWQAVSSELTKPVVTENVQSKISTSDPVVNGIEESNGTAQKGDIDDNSNSHKKKRKRKVVDSTEENNGTTENGKIDDNSNSHKKKRKRKRSEESEEPANDEKDVIKKKKNKRKDHSDEKADEKCNDNPVISSDSAADNENGTTELTFKWDDALIGVLKRAPGKQLALKKLRKKVLGEFNARGGDGKVYTEEKLLAKFMRKASKNKRLKIKKDTVHLVH